MPPRANPPAIRPQPAARPNRQANAAPAQDQQQLAQQLAIEQQQDQMAMQQMAASSQADEAARHNMMIEAQIDMLRRQISMDWIIVYIILMVICAVADLLILIANITVVLWFLGPVVGFIASGLRWGGVALENPGSGRSLVMAAAGRAGLTSAISMVPYVNIVPVQTAAMAYEWHKKQEAVDKANDRIKALRAQLK